MKPLHLINNWRVLFWLTLITSITCVLLINVNTVDAAGIPLPDWMKPNIPELLTRGLSYIVGALLSMLASILAAVSWLFEGAIQYTILEFTQQFQNIQASTDTIWKVFRDLANVMIIGVFVYISFMIILGIQSFSIEKSVVRVLVIAVLINFSLFFTKVVIDVSHITAIQFNKMLQNKIPDTAKNNGISGVIMMYTGFTSITDTQKVIDKAKAKAAAGGTTSVGFGALMLYTLYVSLIFAALISILLYGTILLFTRALTLIFLMIISPIAFAAYMVPQLEKHWQKWWSLLIKNAFFAPLLMLLLWASVEVTIGMGSSNKALLDVITDPKAGNIGILFNLIIILGMFYGSMKLASSMSVMGTNLAESIAKKGFGTAAKWSPIGLTGRLALGASQLGVRGLQNLNRRAPWGGTQLNQRLDSALNKFSDKNEMAKLSFVKDIQKHTGASITTNLSDYERNKFQGKRKKEKEERKNKAIDKASLKQAREELAAQKTEADSKKDASRGVAPEQVGAHKAAEDTKKAMKELGEKIEEGNAGTIGKAYTNMKQQHEKQKVEVSNLEKEKGSDSEEVVEARKNLAEQENKIEELDGKLKARGMLRTNTGEILENAMPQSTALEEQLGAIRKLIEYQVTTGNSGAVRAQSSTQETQASNSAGSAQSTSKSDPVGRRFINSKALRERAGEISAAKKAALKNEPGSKSNLSKAERDEVFKQLTDAGLDKSLADKVSKQ